MPKPRNKQVKKHREGDIPVGSFSDIAFLLIIYFFVATTLVKVKAVTADMPSGETDNSSKSADDTPTINLDGDIIRFKDKKVDLMVLNERLAAMNLDEKEGDKKVIMLESSGQTPYDIYFKALAAISSNGGIVAIVEEED
jgi:biopolymer transport protein ExbD